MSNLTYNTDDDGIAVITWTMPGRTMNVIDAPSIVEFGELIERVLTDDAVKGCIITSDKSSFIAGADLAWMEKLSATGADLPRNERAKAIFDESAKLSALFRRIEKSGKPFAAAMSGTALGGGLELCLACHFRVLADDPKAQIGLPESKVGLLPGAGGTQRLTRMIGPLQALSLLLEGKAMSPREALDLRIVDELTPRDEVVARAKAWLRTATPDAAVKPWDKPGFRPPGDDPRTLTGSLAFANANARQRKKSYGNYPALDAIQKAVYDGLLVPMDTALRIELRYFTELVIDSTSRNLIRTQFLNVQKANKLSRRPVGIPKNQIRKIGVIGAGMMGAGIAHVAARAGLEVVLVDRDQEAADRGREHTYKLELKGGEANADLVAGRINATTDYALLEGASLVIEAVFEDRALKAEVTRNIEKITPEAVIASNTSTLPITSLAEAASQRERFIGIHFFSPVEKMPLIEIIRGKQTGDEALALAMDFAQAIRKTPIVVNDSRGFYTSRVFATYTNEGIRLLADGVSPALIENAGKALGMPVAPLALNDEIAIDLVYKINTQTAKDLGDAYKPSSADRLVDEMVNRQGRLGRKAGKGFYEYPSDGPKRIWPGLADIVTPVAEQPDFEDVKARLLVIQALEAARCFEENVVTDPADADVGAVLGWGFAPWTGGPLSYIDTVGAAVFVETCDRLAAQYGERFKPNALLRKLAAEGGQFYPAAQAA
jgi:3-hydroxyacyl-CoA dehydrogenase/enoyl-CoA hydratase/3-hydroxybutyryl-CoA epimerase